MGLVDKKLSGSPEEDKMLKINYDVNTSVEQEEWCTSLGEMPHESTMDSGLKLENVDISLVKVEETDSNNTESSPWMSQETPEAMTVDQAMDDGQHRCNICLYSARCKCDLTRHMFCHRDPINSDMFKCPFCEYKNNETDHNFEAHLLSHQNVPSKQKCSVCDYLCNSVHDLNSHLFLHKDSSHTDLFKCSLCQYETKILLNLKSHMRVHEKLKCCVCNIEFLNKNNLANHIFKHKDLNNLNWFNCDFCNYKSKYMGSFRLHYNTHKDYFEELTCFICNYTCGAKVDLEKHMRLHKDPENVDLFKCYLCDTKIEKLEDLKIHLLTHLSAGDQKTYCVCPSAYDNSKRNMRREDVNDEGHSSEMYNCDHCDYKSRYIYLFRKHIIRHQVAKCSFCNMKMFQLDLMEHTRIFHSDNSNPNKVFKCCMCNSKCETRSDLARHLLFHKNASNACKVCGRRIKREISWISHMLMHSNVDTRKIHKCNLCPYFTTSLKYLQGHKETHKDRSKRKLFQCPDCKAEYTTKVSLRLHMQDHADKAVSEKWLLHCDRCDFKTKYRGSMRDHKLSHQLATCSFCNLIMNGLDFKKHNEKFHSDSLEHPNNILACCLCVYKCETKSDLAIHLLNHKNIDNICNKCGFKNDTEFSWVSHMLTHSNDNLRKRYKCDQCDYSTVISKKLLLHKEKHKNRSERYLFKCVHCKYKFTTKWSLKMHMKNHVDSSKVVTYNCDYCDYWTKHKSVYKQHKLRHELGICSLCDMEMSASDLKEHEQIFHSDSLNNSNGVLKCCICSCKYETKSDLAKHLLLHKDSKNTCSLCRRIIRKDVSWLSHMLIHSKADSTKCHRCNQCTYFTTILKNLERHKETHKNRPKPPFLTCEGCDTIYSTKYSLGSHIQDNMDQGDSEQSCDHCNYKTKFKCGMKRHKVSHQLVVCNLCNSTMSVSDLKEHNEIVHSETSTYRSNIWICCVCDFTSDSKSDLGKHLVIHKQSVDNICSICGFENKNDSSWVSHMILHSNVNVTKKYKCDQCEYCSVNIQNLQRHKKTHKDRSNRNLFKCSHCDTKFTTKYALKNHALCHADDSTIPSEGPLYQCDKCDYKSKFKQVLTKHKLKHELEKCSVCNLEMSKFDLVTHNKIFHSQVGSDSTDQFKCCICPYKCKIRGDLAKHLLLHKDPKNTCSICGFKLKKEVSWISHMFIHSNANLKKSYKCDQCPYCTTNNKNMKRHKDRHKDRSERNLFECPHCDAKLTTKTSLKLHIQTHFNSSKIMYHCDHCDYKNKYKSKVERHKLKHEKVKCSFCHVNIPSQSELEKHIERSHPECLKVFRILQCGICDNKCETKEDLAKHFLLHKDPTNCGVFKCDICEYKTRYLNNLKLHKTHGSCLEGGHAAENRVPWEETWYRCDVCDYKSKFKCSLKKHILQHQLGRCSVCNLEMSELDLEAHNTIFHSQVGSDSIDELKCCICRYKCKMRGDLAKHLLLHKDPKNTCIICGFKLKKEVSWISHMFIHSNINLRKSYKCDQCSYCTTNKKNMERHINTHKDRLERNLLECPHCDAKLTAKTSLKLHIQTHFNSSSKIIVYHCDHCDYKNKYKTKVERHQLKHKKVKCSFCHVNIESQSEVEKHIEISHPERLKVLEILQCGICDNKCQTKEDLAKHFLFHKDPTSCNVFKCDICEYRTRYLNNLKLHIKHGSCIEGGRAAENRVPWEGTWYRCNECDSKYKWKSSLKKHILKHRLGRCSVCNLEMSELDLEAHNNIFHSEVSNDSIKEFKCCICLYKCETQGELAKHLLLHRDPKNRCGICGYTIQKELSWISHMFIHSNVNSRKSYNCDQCFYCTTIKKNLERHQDTHKDRSERKLLKCPHCYAKLTTKASLNLHIQSHLDSSEVIMYNCDICDYKTKYKSYMTKHKLRHEEVRCSFCHMNIENQSELEKHIGRSHPERLKVFGVLQCDICDNRCETKEDLAKHFLLHKDPTSYDVFKCDTWDYKSRYLNDIKLHKTHGSCLEGGDGTENVIQDNKVKLFQCEEYPFHAVFVQQLDEHLQQSKPSENETIHCNETESSKTMKFVPRDKTKHNTCIKNKDPKLLHNFKCCICGIKFCFTKKIYLSKHLLLHKDPKNPRSFKCNLCNHTARHLAQFKLHYLHEHRTEEVGCKSEGGKRFKCDICPFEAEQHYRLKRHKETHKDPSKRQYFRCPHCNSKYTTKGSLKTHIKHRHSGI